MLKETCSNCHYGVKTNELSMLGQGKLSCVRYPPTLCSLLTNGGIINTSTFPIVDESAWCGEWQQATRPTLTQ
jgi:hypothetical protein